MKAYLLSRKSVLLVVLSVWSFSAQAAFNCTVTATTGLPFGTYNPLSTTDLDVNPVIRVSCTLQSNPRPQAVSYSIALNKGSTAATFNPRQMALGAERLNYNIYTNAARTTIWGDGTSGTTAVTGTFTLNTIGGTSNRNHTMRARIPQGQDVAAGNYTDTVTITLTF
ncbi:MAG: spore coat protein U domain-containing protein [Betaproteobacteria bacterium]|nr:spore coat protein U domain-containing protein [Betaproteobacteria bacterium]